MKNTLIIILISFLAFSLSSCRQGKVTSIDTEGLPDTIIKVTRMIGDNPNDASLYALRAELFLKHKMHDRAIPDADKAITMDPRNPANYLIKADIFFSRGKAHESIQWLKRARTMSANDIRPPLKLGEIYLFIGDYKTSLLYLDTAAKIDDTHPDPWLIGGYSMTFAGDTLNAIRYFNECLKRDKNNYKANIQLAILYTHKLNPIAEQYYENAIGINPQSAEAYYNMGKFYQDLGKFNEAIDAYIAVTRLRDDMGFKDNAFYNLGYIHIELKVWDAARDYFGHAIQANPNYYQAYYAKGYAHEVLGDLQNAKSYYDKALDLKPDYEAARDALHRVIGLIRTPMQ